MHTSTDRLALALALDRDAALMSTSWGLGQILGLNASEAGFPSVDDMIQGMSGSEDGQLASVVSFVVASGLDGALRRRDWTSFASRYNGPSYRLNQYDLRLAAEYHKHASGFAPDLTARAAQLYLTYLGFHPGPVDGVAGRLTRAAVADFQRQQHAAPTGVDDVLVAHLSALIGAGA